MKPSIENLENGKKGIKSMNNSISWNQYFMGVAVLSSLRSKDPNTKVGACIVNNENRIVGIGYSGFPYGCSDSDFPWEREGTFMETKYAYVCHAELNAILNRIQADIHNCTIYSTLFPCNECAKAIIQSKINKVVYLSDKYNGTESNLAAKCMFNAAEVTYIPYEGEAPFCVEL